MKNLSQYYSIEDWIDDFHTLNESAGELTTRQEIVDYYYPVFHKKHPSTTQNDLAFQRIVAAYCWMKKNRNELDTGYALVLGESGSIASSHFLIALYRHFSDSDARTAFEKTTVQEMLQTTEEQRKLNP